MKGEKVHKKIKGKVSEEELKEIIEDSKFESTMFQQIEEGSYPHFGSVIREVKDGDEKSYLIKIRPPLFYLNGLLSNLTRVFSGLRNLKILDNNRWRKREVEYLKKVHPELLCSETGHENAFLIEKIDGESVYDVLRSELEKREKEKVLKDLGRALGLLHKKNVYHGEPNTKNCLRNEKGEIYWIDFEVEYHEDLNDREKAARDLEQLVLSVLGAFEEENEIGLEDGEIVELVLENYGNNEVIEEFTQNPRTPFLGPHRMFQLSMSSLTRFYEAQFSLMDYLKE